MGRKLMEACQIVGFFRAYSQFEDFSITQYSGRVAAKKLNSLYSDMKIDHNKV